MTLVKANTDTNHTILTVDIMTYSKTCVKRPFSKRQKIGFQDQLSLNAGQKYCRMLQGEHSAILLIFIMLQFVIKIFGLSIFDWPLKTGLSQSKNGQRAACGHKVKILK